MEDKETQENDGLSRFAYGLICARNQGDPTKKGYTTYFSPHDVFVTFTYKDTDLGMSKDKKIADETPSSNPDDWKMHVSLYENDDNLEKAWNCVVNVLMKYRILATKILRRGCLLPERQKGKELTIYFQKENVEWEKMFNEIEKLFIENNIQPSYKPVVDKAVEGSQFFSCRCESGKNQAGLSGLQAKTHNPSGKPHVFERLRIYAKKQSQESKPIRKNEERVEEFYSYIEKKYLEILFVFREKFNFGKKVIFSQVDEEEVKNNYRGFKKYEYVNETIKEIVRLGKLIEHSHNSTDEVVEKMSSDEYHGFLQEKAKECERIEHLMTAVSQYMDEHSESSPHSSDGSVVVKGTPPREERSSASDERSNSDAAASSSSDESETIQEDFAQRMPLSPRARK